MIIVKQSQIEYFISSYCKKIDPSLVGNKYIVFGTFNKADWKKYSQQTTYPQEAFDKVYVFKDVKQFEIFQGGWMKDNR